MSETLGMRTASIGASALLLAGLVGLALNASYVVRQWGGPDAPTIDVTTVDDTKPPAPPEPVKTRPQPPHPIEDVVIAPPPEPTSPIEEIVAIEPPTALAGAAAPEIINADWRRRPRDLGRYYPAPALRRGMEGLVDLNCRVSVQGRLSCAVVSETPEGWGFAEAALRISRDYEIVPATRGGTPVEARYRMRVPFSVE